MDSRPAPLRLTADRRAQEGGAAVPSYEVRGPVSKTMGRATPPWPAASGLTRRERKVRDVLVQELEKLGNGDLGAGLSYNEIQKLEKTLDHTFIDAELAKMRKQLRWIPKMLLCGVLLGAVCFLSLVAGGLRDGTADPLDALISLLPLVAGLVSPAFQARALRRKIFIYEALRELSDAEDADVQLDESVRLADLLIDRILDADEAPGSTPLSGTAAPPRRVRS